MFERLSQALNELSDEEMMELEHLVVLMYENTSPLNRITGASFKETVIQLWKETGLTMSLFHKQLYENTQKNNHA